MPKPIQTSFLRMWFWALSAVFLLSGCQQTANSHSAKPISSQQWLMDKGGNASLQDIQAATGWQSLPDWKSWGYGPETIWLRLELNTANADEQMPWVIQVSPPYLDYVTLYDPTHGLVQRTGDALPMHADELESINLTFVIPPLPIERVIFLKIRSTSNRLLHVSAMPYGVAQRSNQTQERLTNISLTTSALFALWAMAQWWYSRDRVIGAFAIKQVIDTAWIFFLFGFARVFIGHWFPEGLLTATTSVILIWMITATIWFYTILIKGYKPSRIALRACYGLNIFLGLLPLLQWFVQPYTMLFIANACIPLGMVLLSATMLTAARQPTPQPIPLKWMLAYVGCFSLINSVSPLMFLGVFDANWIVMFSLLIHTVFDGIVVFFMLQFRAQALQKQQQQDALDILRSQENTKVEARHREEQSQLFAMLAHEMKTPLASLRMWMETGPLKRETMERAIADMNQVIERCVHTGQLADHGLQPDWQNVGPVELTNTCILACRQPDRIDFSMPEGNELMQTDAQMLSIALGNLLDNACKYGAPQTRVLVTLEPCQQNGISGWLWRVDNAAGPAGLPDIVHLFQKYYRSQQARRLSGSGLGLFLVRGLLDLMQGTISYESQADHAVFSLWAPEKPA